MKRTVRNFFVLLGGCAMLTSLPIYFAACNEVAKQSQPVLYKPEVKKRVILMPEELPGENDLMIVLKANEDTIDIGYWRPDTFKVKRIPGSNIQATSR